MAQSRCPQSAKGLQHRLAPLTYMSTLKGKKKPIPQIYHFCITSRKRKVRFPGRCHQSKPSMNKPRGISQRWKQTDLKAQQTKRRCSQPAADIAGKVRESSLVPSDPSRAFTSGRSETPHLHSGAEPAQSEAARTA